MGISATTFHSGRQLGENELLPVDTQCPLCLNGETRHPILLLQSKPDVHLVHCSKCHGFSASRMPTQETLREYYGKYYSDRSGDHVTFDAPEKFARHLLKRAGHCLT